MRLILLIASCMLLFLKGFSQIRYMPINGKFAFVKPYYPDLITEPKYESVQLLNEHIFLVSLNGKYGIVDSTGKEIIKADTYTSYFEIKDYNTYEKFYQLYIVGTTNNCLINSKGKCIAKNIYQIEKKLNDLFLVSVSTEDSVQKKLFFTEKDRFNSKKGIMDLNGNWVVRPDGRTYEFPNNYYICAYNPDDLRSEYILLDRKGNPIINELVRDFDKDKRLPDTVSSLKRSFVETDEYTWMIDSTGKIISKFKPKYPGVYPDIDDKGRWGAKQNGKWIIKPSYSAMEVPNQYIFAFNNPTHTTDVYDRRGKFIIKLPYHSLYACGASYLENENDQYYAAKSAKGFVILNHKFAVISAPQRETSTCPLFYSYENDSVVFAFESYTKLRGVMNRYGKIIIPAQYKERIYNEGHIITARAANKLYDLYDQAGKLLMKGVSSVDQSRIDGRFYLISKNGKEGVYTLNPFKEITSQGAYTSLVEIDRPRLTMAISDDKKYLLNKNFELASPTAYKSILKDKENDSTLVLVGFNGKMQFIDSQVNKINIELDEFDSYSGSGTNEKLLVWANKKYGIFNAFGKTLLACEWDTIINAHGGVILKKNGSYFLADTNFVINKNIIADSIISIEYGEGFAYRKNNKWRFANDDNVEFDKIESTNRKEFIEIKSNGKTGVYDMLKKTWVLKPVFDSMPEARNTRTPHETLFSFKKGGKNYIVDPVKGNVKPEAYSYIESANYNIDARVPEGIDNFIVYKDGDKPNTGKFGIMNYKGEFLHPPDADHILPIVFEYYDVGWASLIGMLWNKGGVKYKYVSSPPDSIINYEPVDGTNANYTVSEPKYDEKIVGGKFGIVNSRGKEILPVIYDDIQFMFTYNRKERNARRSFSDSVFDRTGDNLIIKPVFLRKDKKYGAADLTGKIVIPVEYNSIADITLNEKELIQVWKNKKFGLFDLFGKELLPAEITYLQEYKLNYYSPAMTLCQKGGTATTYTIAAQERDETTYDPDGYEHVSTTKDTIELQYLSGGKFGLFNQDNFKWFLDPEYDDIRFNQCFNVDKTDKIIKMKATEKFNLRPEFILRDSLALFEIKKGEKWGVYQLKKGIVLQPNYDDVDAQPSVSNIKIKQNGKWGIIDLSGVVILKPEFDDITLLEESLYKATQAGTIKYYTLKGKVTEAK